MSRPPYLHPEVPRPLARWPREAAFDNHPVLDQEETAEGVLHLKDLLPRLVARWHWIALGLVLGFAVGLYQVWRTVPQYRALATVQVKDSNISAITGQSLAEDFDLRNKNAMNTVRESFLRTELLETVASDPELRKLAGLIPQSRPLLPRIFGAGSDSDQAAEALMVPAAPDLAKRLLRWINVSIRGETRLIDIAVEHPEPAVAAAIANKVISSFIAESEDHRKEGSSGSLTAITIEADRVSRELEATHALLANYASSLDAERALAAAEEEAGTLSLRYREFHPKLIAAANRLEQRRQELSDALSRAVQNPSDREYWEGHVQQLGPPSAKEMLKYRELLTARSAVLKSRIDSETSFHRGLLDRKGSHEATKDGLESEVVRYQDARLPERPVSPNKMRIIVGATAMGIMAGFGLAFIFQYFDNKLHTVADVESAFGLPVLAALMKLPPEEGATSKGGPSQPSPLVADPESPLAVGRERWTRSLIFREEQSGSHSSEMFRVLRTSISLLGPAEERKVTLITSALAGEGKSFVAANFALSLAHQGLRTLLIDFDLRKPSLHKAFGEERESQPGITNLLVGQSQPSEVVRTRTGQNNLYLILAGSRPPSPGELLNSSRLAECLLLFRAHFDHIVLDSAPMLPVPDTRILAPFADTSCLIVRADSTPRGAVNRALGMLHASNAAPDGIIFNGYHENRFQMGKNYSYGSYRNGRYGLPSSYGAVYGEADEDS